MSALVNGVCFDWFEFTTKIDSVRSIIDMMGLSDYDFMETYGSSGYRQGCMFENIFIFSDGLEGMGIHIRMSGKGCRAFEKYSKKTWKDLYEYIVENSDQMNVSRLDVAYDDFIGLLDIEKIVDDVNDRRYVTRFRSDPEVIYTVDQFKKKSYTVNFGRKSSNTFLRFYDKFRERASKDIITQGCSHWVRAEFMFRNNNAFRFLQFLAEGKNMMELYFLVMNNYLRFVVENDSDTNRWRWETADHWERFCNSVLSDKIGLYVAPAEKYDIFRLSNYVTGQAGAAIYTYIQKFSVNDLVEKVENKKYKLSLKYRELLS